MDKTNLWTHSFSYTKIKKEMLDENSVIRNFRTTATDGKEYWVKYYNLDVIISVGYRVKSQQAHREICSRV